MWRMIRSHLRHGLGRSVALLLGIGIAATSFAVLTGTAETSRLAVVGEVKKSFRPPNAGYDLLIRPPGSTTPLESQQGLIRPNSLAGIAGGITMEQYRKIGALPGVEVAAPIAMIGYVKQTVHLDFDLSPYLAGSGPEVLRIRRTSVTDRGLTRIPEDFIYVYVTDKLRQGAPATTEGAPATTGAGGGVVVASVPDQVDVTPEGPKVACTAAYSFPSDAAPFTPGARAQRVCFARQHSEAPTAYLDLEASAFIAAIDPIPENQLSGLDGAIISGRPLNASDLVVNTRTETGAGVSAEWTIPALVASPPAVDEQLELSVERLPSSSEVTFRANQADIMALDAALRSLPGTSLGTTSVDFASRHRAVIVPTSVSNANPNAPADTGMVRFNLDTYWSATAADLRQVGPTQVTPLQHGLGIDQVGAGFPISWYHGPSATLKEPAYRALTPHTLELPEGGTLPSSRLVGVYDPAKLPELTGLTGLATGLYDPPNAVGADAQSRALLGDRPLAPDGSPTGYLSAPPTILTTLEALKTFHDAVHFPGTGTTAPLSVIRVRVAGVTGPDSVSMERIRVVAEKIQATTGLQVDIVAGASASPVQVDLPAGKFGRPALALSEGWSKKGVAFAAITAQDRKSLVLFGLILVVCALFAANAVTAAVRTRTSELALLSGIGWSRHRTFALVLAEVGLVGLVAGGLGTLVAVPAASLFHLDVPWSQALLAWPAAVLLALVAGLVPALRAARLSPLEALRPAVHAGHRAIRGRTVTGLATSGVARVPGRTAVGACALGVAVAATTILAALIIGFRGQVVGSLLGDAVALQARPGDVFAAVAMVVLALAAVSDVIYLNVRDRTREIGILQASGWTRWALARLIGTEALLLGALGAVPGAALGLAASVGLAGESPPTLWAIAAAATCGAVLLSGLAAVVPLLGVLRVRTSRLLAGV